MPKLSGTNNVPITRTRYQASTSIPGGSDDPQADHISESKQPLPSASSRQTRHERSVIPERVSSDVIVCASFFELCRL